MKSHLGADKIASLVKKWSRDQIASYHKPTSLPFFKAAPRKPRALTPQGFGVYHVRTNIFGDTYVSSRYTFLMIN